MNKEQQELLDEAYENYSKEYEKDNSIGMCLLVARIDGKSTYRKPNKEMFIDLCTLDTEFSEKWGLKIEERELSFNERIKHIVNSLESNAPLLMENDDKTIQWLDKNNVPTKLITLYYHNKTITSYE